MAFNLATRLSLATGALAFALIPGLALATMESGSPMVRQGTVLAAQPAATAVEQLNLSDQQKQKMRALRKTRNQEISKVLNDTQRKKLVQALKSGTKLGAALQTLNLSADQKRKIVTIVQKSNQQMKATLTAKQLQQLESIRKQHQTAAQTLIE